MLIFRMFPVHKEKIFVQILMANKLQLKLLMIQANCVLQVFLTQNYIVSPFWGNFEFFTILIFFTNLIKVLLRQKSTINWGN